MDPMIESQENYLYTEEDEVNSSSNAPKKRVAKKPEVSAAVGGARTEKSIVKSKKTDLKTAEVKDESADLPKKRVAKKPAASATARGARKTTETPADMTQTVDKVSEVTDEEEARGITASPKRSDGVIISNNKDQDVSAADNIKSHSLLSGDVELPKDKKSSSGVDEANTYQHDLEFIASQKEALLAERSTYLEQANNLREEAESLINEAEPGDVQFDEESGEGGTATVDRERDLALSAQALNAVEEINYALHKIELGKYGVCEGCGELIVKDRLEALPYARLCVACKSGGLSRR